MPVSLLLPQRESTSLAEHLRRVRVRIVSSRVVVVLAILGLLSATSRPLRRAFAAEQVFVPGLVPTTSRSTLVLVSIVMLLLARGLRRGNRLARLGSVAALAISAVLHAVSWVGVAESVVSLAAATWLAVQVAAFPVMPSRGAVRQVVRWMLLGVLGLAGLVGAIVAWIAVATPQDSAVDHVIRFLDHLVDVLDLTFLGVLLWTLLSPRHPPVLSDADHRREKERARLVVARFGGGTLDYFALRDDKDWFFVGNTVVAYSVRNGVCLVSPDPIGPPEERELAWSDFLDFAGEFGWSVAVVAASTAWLPVYEATGQHAVYVGDEAIVDCPTFTLTGPAHKSLRQAVNRVARAGYVTTFHDPTAVPDDLRAALKEMCGESRRGDGERGYAMTLSRLFDPADTGLMLSVTRNAEGRVDAFCQWMPASDVDGWSLDVMRRRRDHDGVPNGLINATIVATIAELCTRGEKGLALNFAVLREVLAGQTPTRLESFSRPLIERLSRGTQMASLSAFNEKFGPSWVPRYVVLDSAEYIAAQAVVVAAVEGVTEIPVVGRFLGSVASTK